MSNAEAMRRGAREANEESHRTARSRAMGEAIGGLAAFVAAINRLSERVEALGLRIRHLEQGTQP